MLMLLGLALPIALLGFAISDDDDDGESAVTENGTAEDDRIEGGQGDDFLDGEEGNDILNGQAGNDTLFGRDGDDVLEGQDGDDMLCSGDGNDIITGNRGTDLIEGQEGDDWVSGDYSSDTVYGNEGNDTVIGGRGNDGVYGEDGDDVVFGGILQNIPLNLNEMTELRDGGSLADINGGIEMRDDSIGNDVRGGAGDDDVIIGSLDMAMGNDGADTFHIMSEQNNGYGDNAPTILNFDAEEDAITVIVDNADADQDVTVVNEGGDAVVRMGETILARVQGAAGQVGTPDITLISESFVENMFDPAGAAT